MSNRFKSGDGDWTCGDLKCGNLNFARRTNCNRCGKQKEMTSDSSKKKQGIEIGKVAAEKSHGLFSAEDWQCSKCGNVNWARRQTCNMCNAPKVGEVEERTGYGGGFNEREGVEYIEREDTDDEFDEFGRRKKKIRSSSEQDDDQQEIPKKMAVPDKCDDEEEEEEEDDDDGDLSKYDLWQNDSEEEKDEKEEEEDDKTVRNPSSANSISNAKDHNSASIQSKCDSRSASCSPSSSLSSLSSSKGHSRLKDQSPVRSSVRRSPERKASRDRSRSCEANKSNRRLSSRSSRSRSRSRSGSRSFSKDKKHSRR